MPVAVVAEVPELLVSHPAAPFADFKGFIAYAKANPGKLNYSSAGNGTLPHVTMELLLRGFGVEVAHIPYRGAAPAMTDLLAGQVQLKMDTYATANQHVAAGKLRALAYAARARSAQLPEVPTVAEMGLPGYEGVLWMGIVAPAGTPQPVIEKLAAAVKRAVGAAEVAERLKRDGIDPVGTGSGGIRRTDRARDRAMARAREVGQHQAGLNAHACRDDADRPRLIPNPRTPRVQCPPGTVDTHIHLFGPAEKYTWDPNTYYVARDATPEMNIALQDKLGFANSVIVSGGAYGRNYTHLSDTLTRFPDRFRGVALIPDDLSDAEFVRLAGSGCAACACSARRAAAYCRRSRSRSRRAPMSTAGTCSSIRTAPTLRNSPTGCSRCRTPSCSITSRACRPSAAWNRRASRRCCACSTAARCGSSSPVRCAARRATSPMRP